MGTFPVTASALTLATEDIIMILVIIKFRFIYIPEILLEQQKTAKCFFCIQVENQYNSE
jgi:hypothetical protein